MSQRLISRSPDLQRLQSEGYEVSIRNGYLLIGHVPYRNSTGAVAYGTLVSNLQLQGDATVQPTDHRAWFIGEAPHGTDGAPMGSLIGSNEHIGIDEGLTTNFMFSRKLKNGNIVRPYTDYCEKIKTYLGEVSTPALALDPDATAVTHPVVPDEEGDSVFRYIDTATARAGIAEASEKLKVDKIAIVGLGGTGSYILDLLVKTPIKEIHLYDGDGFYQHNAFRSPGGPSVDDLEQKLSKVEHFARLYGGMRTGIVAHDYFVEPANLDELREMNFVFIAADSGEAKRLISEKLVGYGVKFIDVGMGLWRSKGVIGGNVRITTGTPEKHDHLEQRMGAAGNEADRDDPYGGNVQIAELNALNAAFAVTEWKRLVGFYDDDEREHNSTYSIGGNIVIKDDVAA
jgi:ThiF family